jgi:Domain of unknown function (DUF4263)
MTEKNQSVCTWYPDKIAGLDPVDWNVSRPDVVEKFRRVLSHAKDERPLQRFFEENPIALVAALVPKAHNVWVIPRPSLPLPQGGGGIPDFIVCEWSSIGPLWIIVELESPTKSPVIRTGLSRTCNFAIQQIEQYTTYLRDHASFLRNNGWPELHGDCRGVVVIGRRTDTGRLEHRLKLEAKRRAGIDIASYDRILEPFEEKQLRIGVHKDSLERFLKEHPLKGKACR